MLRNKIRFAVVSASVLAGGLFASQARAITTVENVATANYKNSATMVQDAQTGTAYFGAQSNPKLLVEKTADKAAGPKGTIVTWSIRVSYPKIADITNVCGDDSPAWNVVVTDPIPSEFTYNTGTLEASVDNGTTWKSAPADLLALGITLSEALGTVTATLPDLIEGQGDAACAPGVGTALVVRFKATKN